MASIYIETSVVGYATSRMSELPHVLARQQSARRWWAEKATLFDLFVSQVVVDESNRGDADAAAERSRLLDGVPLIPITAEVSQVATELLARSLLPPNAAADALHVAAAAVANVDYLLTFNCRHIANAFRLPMIYATLEQLNVGRPLICTPDEFLGGDDAGG